MSIVEVDPEKLRSRLSRSSPRYYTRRSQWAALGIPAENLDKPKIAVVNSSSKISPCFSHLDDLAQEVVEAIQQVGGLGFEIRTVAPSDFLMSAGAEGGYVLASRDLISFDIEAVVEGAQLDGMICLASCDKTTPGQIMAALRTNIPTIVVCCGYQGCGSLGNKDIDIEEVFMAAGHLARGGITTDQLDKMCEVAIESPGVCAGLGTANTMHAVAETLGFAELGSTPRFQGSKAIQDAVSNSARLIMKAINSNVRPRDLVTIQSIRNVAQIVLAMGGSLNAIKHLQAFVLEAGQDFDVAQIFQEVAKTSRPIVAVRPNGPYPVANFDKAGGTAALMKSLSDELDLSVRDAVGNMLGDELGSVSELNATVPGITTLDKPFSNEAAIAVVRGNLAPGYGLLKLAVDETRPKNFQGPAKVFAKANDAIMALNDGQVEEGAVLVLRGLGPKGTPGMGMASNVVFAIDGVGLTNKVAFITDGQFSGLVNKGIAVGEVYPEGIGKTPFAVIQDGDEISFNFEENAVHLHISDQELLARIEQQPEPERNSSRRFLDYFAESYEDKYFSPIEEKQSENVGQL